MRRVARALLIAIASGGLLGFPAPLTAAEPLEVPGPIVELPAYTEFRLVPVARTRYARFAKAYFAGQGQRYLRDPLGNPFAYAILAGRHRITGGNEPDLVLMVVPLVRQCCDRAEVKAMVFARQDGRWQEAISTEGFGTPRGGAILALVSPVVGVTYSGGDIDPPFWVPPMRDGRRTIVWNGDGMFWNGSEWDHFCWRQCGERG